MLPMHGRKIIEGEHLVFIFFQALHRLRILVHVGRNCDIKGFVSVLSGRRHPDFMQGLLYLGLNTLRQFIQDIGRFVNPTPLMAGLWINLAQGCPES